mmetsp:Transcript_32806/g.78097  ORF Transcript_32806/g.78097 Transcript_32806/m.78097 type:complete len:210 (-) Transcript_32806:41-670(-)
MRAELAFCSNIVLVLVFAVLSILIILGILSVVLAVVTPLCHGRSVVDLHEVAEAHLRGVVDDVLAALQAHRGEVPGLVAPGLLVAHLHGLPQRDLHAVGHGEALALPIGAALAYGHGGVGPGHRRLQVGRHPRLERLAQGHLCQQEVLGLRAASAAVAQALAGHVGEVDALPEGVARGGSLRRGDPEALGQDADEVAGRRAVPQQLVLS